MPVLTRESCTDAVKSLFDRYCHWLAKNPALSKEFELGVKLSSYILVNLVDNGSSSDARHQIIYCLSDLLGFVNDFAVSRAYPGAGLPYGNNLKTWLTVAEYCEVCFELGAQQLYGTDGKWTAILLMQLFKCVARAMLVVKRNEGLLPFPPIVPLRREALPELEFMKRSDPTFNLGSGVVIRRVESGPSFINASQRPTEDFRTLLRDNQPYVFRNGALIGEVLYSLKPLIHLGVMKFTGRHSWQQWLTSLFLECVSLRLQWKDYSGKRFSDDQQWQYTSRIVSLLVYLVRSPFYDHYVKSIILSVLIGLRRLFPFLKIVLNPCIEFLPAWHETYFYLWSH